MDLQLRSVTYRYPTASTDALRDVSLSVAPGELVGVIGLNGGGKTTLCNLLVGFVPHFYHGELSGEVIVEGVATRENTIAQLASRVGYVFQQPAQQFSGTAMTVYEEVAFGPENLGLPRTETQRRVTEALQLLRIEALAERSPWEISGGQQQRVALASILAMQPRILVLDEPTSQLDPVGTREVFAAIRDLWQQGKTIVLVEHKLDLLAKVATRIIHLHAGRIVADGQTDDVLRSPRLSEFGLEPPTTVRLGRALGITPPPLTIEEAARRLEALA